MRVILLPTKSCREHLLGVMLGWFLHVCIHLVGVSARVCVWVWSVEEWNVCTASAIKGNAVTVLYIHAPFAGRCMWQLLSFRTRVGVKFGAGGTRTIILLTGVL